MYLYVYAGDIRENSINKTLKVHDFSSTLYRWAYDYFNSVNDLLEKHPGIQMFAVKYNNACLAFELIVKSHIAYINHTSDIAELDKIMKKYGHSIIKLAEYAEANLKLVLNEDDWEKLKLVDKYYANHTFRYPPYEPRKTDLDHRELLDAIEKLRTLTAGLLVVVHMNTNGYVIKG